VSKGKSYTLEFKQSSAKLAAESGQSIAQTARELGINENTLHGWVGKYYRHAKASQVDALPLEDELKRLRKENARLKQERDILKKAAAYFASETQ
jgi:transposase